MWTCSRNVLEHLFLNVVFPPSFTSLPSDVTSGWVLKLHVWECADRVSDATMLAFVVNVKEDQDVVLTLEVEVTEKARNAGGVHL